MTCKACIERGQPDNFASMVRCAFESEEFIPDWNCATVGMIRYIANGYKHQTHVDSKYCDDQWYATIKISDVELPNGLSSHLCLWISWYKNRGSTDAMWILCSDREPTRPTEGDCLAIIEYYKEKEKIWLGEES